MCIIQCVSLDTSELSFATLRLKRLGTPAIDPVKTIFTDLLIPFLALLFKLILTISGSSIFFLSFYRKKKNWVLRESIDKVFGRVLSSPTKKNLTLCKFLFANSSSSTFVETVKV